MTLHPDCLRVFFRKLKENSGYRARLIIRFRFAQTSATSAPVVSAGTCDVLSDRVAVSRESLARFDWTVNVVFP